MSRSPLAPLALAVVLSGAACGSSSKAHPASSTTTPTDSGKYLAWTGSGPDCPFLPAAEFSKAFGRSILEPSTFSLDVASTSLCTWSSSGATLVIMHNVTGGSSFGSLPGNGHSVVHVPGVKQGTVLSSDSDLIWTNSGRQVDVSSFAEVGSPQPSVRLVRLLRAALDHQHIPH